MDAKIITDIGIVFDCTNVNLESNTFIEAKYLNGMPFTKSGNTSIDLKGTATEVTQGATIDEVMNALFSDQRDRSKPLPEGMSVTSYSVYRNMHRLGNISETQKVKLAKRFGVEVIQKTIYKLP